MLYRGGRQAGARVWLPSQTERVFSGVVMSQDLPRPSWTIPRVPSIPTPTGAWNGDLWNGVTALAIDQFHPRSSAHRPQVHAKLAHDSTSLAIVWRVQDRLVLSRTTTVNGPVCTDSCVEFFFQPTSGPGYFNLEINAGGTPHCSWIEDCRIVDGGFAQMRFVDPADLAQMRIHHSQPAVVDPEVSGPQEWTVEAVIPLTVLQRYAGSGCQLSGTWRGNLYKCADHTSGPHWAAWADVGETLRFHKPSHFASLVFG